MKKYTLAAMLMLGAVNVAQAESLTESLLHCDSQFFNRLYEQRKTFKKLAPLQKDNAHHAWFTPQAGNNGTIWFSQPLKINGLSASGYYLQQNDLGAMGKYYYWGLIFDDSPESVIAALPDAGWRKAGEDFSTNALIKRPGDKEWKINTASASGIAPAKGSTEKVALLSVSNNKTKLLCTVQGNVSEEMLGSLRPDLKAGKK